MSVAASRRWFLGTAGCLLIGCSRSTPRSEGPASSARAAVAELEAKVGGRIGLCARDTGTGAELRYRAEERFALCSTFKWTLAAAVLHRVEHGELALTDTVAFSGAELLEYAPVTRARVAEGRMTLEELLEASVGLSDNTAANLLLSKLGGPAGLTRFVRAQGDAVTRLDRDEPGLNENAPGDARDTTTPLAMAALMERVLLGATLAPASRALLLRWMAESPTGEGRLRARLPVGWRAADKTGTGARGAVNDVAVLWPAAGAAPWVVAAYLSDSAASVEALSEVHAALGELVAREASARFG